MSDKEFKQKMILALSANSMLYDLAKVSQVKHKTIGEVLVRVSTETCDKLNESCDKPNQ